MLRHPEVISVVLSSGPLSHCAGRLDNLFEIPGGSRMVSCLWPLRSPTPLAPVAKLKSQGFRGVPPAHLLHALQADDLIPASARFHQGHIIVVILGEVRGPGLSAAQPGSDCPLPLRPDQGARTPALQAQGLYQMSRCSWSVPTSSISL